MADDGNTTSTPEMLTVDALDKLAGRLTKHAEKLRWHAEQIETQTSEQLRHDLIYAADIVDMLGSCLRCDRA